MRFKRDKIAILMPGYHQLLYDFCRYLSIEGYKVTLILPERKKEGKLQGNGFNITYLKVPIYFFNLPLIPTLYSYLRKENFDIIISGEDFQPMTFIAAFYASKFNKQLFIIAEKYFLSRFFFLRQLHKMQLKFIAPIIWKKSKMIISHSSAAQKFLISNGAPKEKVIYLPVGIDINKFKPILLKKKSKCVNILSVARLIYHKGLFNLLDAMNELKTKGCNFKLTIVGDGPLLKPLLEKIKMDELSDSVEIIRSVPHSKMPEIYNNHDIFVLNSVIEVVGISVMEAMACGKPLIVTNVGGLPDFVVDGKNGYIVNPNDSINLSEKIETLTFIGHLTKMGEESLKLATERFNWKIVIKGYIKIFEN